jgi:hypothetical protein
LDRRQRRGGFDIAGFNPVCEFEGINLPLGDFALVDV